MSAALRFLGNLIGYLLAGALAAGALALFALAIKWLVMAVGA